MVIGVNPRHASYYKRRMGFRQIGAQQHYARVGAPVVLLRRRLSFLREDVTLYPDHHKKGQTVAYLGPDIRAFLAAYGGLGRALLPQPHLAELVSRLETLQTALLDAQRALPAKGADRAYGALGRAADVAGMAVWSAMKHGGAMELWNDREVDRAAA